MSSLENTVTRAVTELVDGFPLDKTRGFKRVTNHGTEYTVFVLRPDFFPSDENDSVIRLVENGWLGTTSFDGNTYHFSVRRQDGTPVLVSRIEEYQRPQEASMHVNAETFPPLVGSPADVNRCFGSIPPSEQPAETDSRLMPPWRLFDKLVGKGVLEKVPMDDGKGYIYVPVIKDSAG